MANGLTKHELTAVQISAGVSVALLLWTMQGRGERRTHEWRSRSNGRILELTIHAFPPGSARGYHSGYLFDLHELGTVADVWHYAAAAFERIKADLERLREADDSPAAVARAQADFLREHEALTGRVFGGTDI